MNLRFIERLREKPKEVRVQVSFLSALCVTGVIGLLWGVTLPTRLQGLPQGDETAQAQDGRTLNSFFADTRENLGQLIGATNDTSSTDSQNELVNSAPKSDAYRVGAPEGEGEYTDYSFEPKEAVVVPVNRREVRIGTTTTRARNQ